MKNTRMTIGVLGLVAMTAGSMSLLAQRPQNYGQQPGVRMSGTYELDSTRGDDPRRAAEAASWSNGRGRGARGYQSLVDRLEAPRLISIDRNNRTVTIASSRGPQVTLDVDGDSRTEIGPNGQPITSHAEIWGDSLTIATRGDRNSDFTVTFQFLNNGTSLLVTRRLDDANLREPVSVRSYYRRTANQARWDVYGSEPNYPVRNPNDGPGRGYNPPPPPPPVYVVPDGTRLVATLDTSLSTNGWHSDERFMMTVRSPAAFQGARIEGTVVRVNERRGGGRSSDMYIDFNTIQMRGGRVSEFSGYLNTVRTPDGVTLRVDSRGTTKDPDATQDRVQNGAIGAALGAIIGAIAGGGKGAAIGAVVGGAGGAIMVDGRDSLDLPPGTEVTITAFWPRRQP